MLKELRVENTTSGTGKVLEYRCNSSKWRIKREVQALPIALIFCGSQTRCAKFNIADGFWPTRVFLLHVATFFPLD